MEKKEPSTPDQWAEWAHLNWASDKEYKSEKYWRTEAIQRAQEQARNEALEDAGNEFTMVCYWKEKAAQARIDAIKMSINLVQLHANKFEAGQIKWTLSDILHELHELLKGDK